MCYQHMILYMYFWFYNTANLIHFAHAGKNLLIYFFSFKILRIWLKDKLK